MFFTIGCRGARVLVLAALTLVLAAEAAHAQGRCAQRQQTAANGLRPRLYSLQQPYTLQAQPYALQQYALQQYALQQNVLRQYALQQYALQQYALQQYALQPYAQQQLALQGQLNASQQNGLLSAQPNGPATVDALQAQLNALQQYTLLQDENGQLTPSQLRKLRQQEKALTKKLRAAEQRSAEKQSKQARSQTPATEDR